jgi:hypothetical protein
MSTTLVHYPYFEGSAIAVKETVPTYIPTTTETLLTEKCWAESVVLSNNSASAITVTIADRQANPLPLIPTSEIAANETLAIPLLGRLCPDGLTWVASAPGVVGYVRVRI